MAKPGNRKDSGMPADEEAFIALGANITGAWGTPWQGMMRALMELAGRPDMRVLDVSGIWRCAPFGVVHQPVFFNAVAKVRTQLPPRELLRVLTDIERRAGRRRGRAWAARVLDLDLLALGGRVVRPVGMGRRGGAQARHAWQKRGLILPHPGMHERAFVLAPLAEMAPTWRHPLLGATVAQLQARLPRRNRAWCQRVAYGGVFFRLGGGEITIGCARRKIAEWRLTCLFGAVH